jgi:hypothetical protein
MGLEEGYLHMFNTLRYISAIDSLKKKRMDDVDPAIYPYGQDLKDFNQVVQDYVQEYIDVWYSTDAEMVGDQELRKFWSALRETIPAPEGWCDGGGGTYESRDGSGTDAVLYPEETAVEEEEEKEEEEKEEASAWNSVWNFFSSEEDDKPFEEPDLGHRARPGVVKGETERKGEELFCSGTQIPALRSKKVHSCAVRGARAW